MTIQVGHKLMQNHYPCPQCGNPLTVPELIEKFVFVEDLEQTMDLFEGRLNSVICPLCKEKISFFTGVTVINYEEKSILVVLPENQDETENTELYSLAEQNNLYLKICHNYDELCQVATSWIDRYIVPIGSRLMSDEFDRFSTEQKVSWITPFFLRVLKASLDGYLPPVWQFSGGSSEEKRQVAERLYRRIILDHLIQLRMWIVEQNQFTALLSVIDEHVPQVCLTKAVLEDLANRCGPFVDPKTDLQGFIRGYLDEYLCAATHACAGVLNPRGGIFASYLATCWYSNQHHDVVLDARLLLSNEVIHRVIRFEDLWDLLIYQPPNLSMTGDELKEIFTLLSDFGFQAEAAQTVESGILRICNVEQIPQDTKKQLEDIFLETIVENCNFNSSPQDSENIGVLVAQTVRDLLRNQLQDQAFAILDQILEKGINADDPIACVSICSHTIKVLCENMQYAQASELAGAALEFLDDNRLIVLPSLIIQVWNEIGNVARYLHHLEEALEAYRIVEKIIEIAPIEEKEKRLMRLTVKRNIGIAYREMGNYFKALESLKAASHEAPEDAGILHNLSVLYTELSRYDEALHCLDRAVEMSFGELRAPERARYLFSRSHIWLALGKMETGLQDLKDAYENTPGNNLFFRSELAAEALSYYPESPEGKQFVAECQTVVEQRIAEGGHLASPLLYGSLCTRLLREGQLKAAEQVFAPFWERIEATKSNYDWKIAHIQGWLQYEKYRDESCWPFILEALEKIDANIPSGENIQFAPFWMQNKNEFQDLLVTVALELVVGNLLPTKELLGVYEFMNGREISARLLREQKTEMNTGEKILARITSHPRASQRNLKAFFFIETQSEVHLACLDARDGTVCLVDLPPLNLADLGMLKSKLRQTYKRANPANVSLLDKKLADWENLSRQLGVAIAPYIQPGAHICFLPGRAFTGLPLHLLIMPDGRYLVESNPVSFAPNFTVLLDAGAGKAAEHGDGSVIVTVTKASETSEFKQNALAASQELIALLTPQTSVKWLQEQQADINAVKTALAESSEVIFLCHGTTAGSEKGYGICIAAGGLLPPAILSVRDVPEHVRFILNWEDIEQSPPTFVSIACSSGITELAKGGVRFGLEQTLFSSGTTRIISPLWDVNQESSLYWIQAFYQARQSESTFSIEEAYQHACMTVQQRFPHYFFWGPFIMNGAL